MSHGKGSFSSISVRVCLTSDCERTREKERKREKVDESHGRKRRREREREKVDESHGRKRRREREGEKEKERKRMGGSE